MKPLATARRQASTGGIGAVLAVCAAWSLHASMASAQVMELGGGQVTTYDGPAVFSAGGVQPIVTARTPGVRHDRRRRGVAPAQPPADVLATAAGSAALSPELVSAVAWQESRYRSGVVSRAGAVGEMQLMPGTARALGVDPYDSGQNYHGGAAYLRVLMQRYDGDLVRTLAAYDAGPGAVDRYGGVPPYRETRAYVSSVLDRLSLSALQPTVKGTR